MQNKIETLSKFLDVSLEDAENLIDDDYLVLTDEEANERVKEEILNSLWAFNADFILQHNQKLCDSSWDEWESALESLREAQKKQCESLNGLVYALIDDVDEFVEDAINADGRGHFLAFYDGEEHESNGYFIYRIN